VAWTGAEGAQACGGGRSAAQGRAMAAEVAFAVVAKRSDGREYVPRGGRRLRVERTGWGSKSLSCLRAAKAFPCRAGERGPGEASSSLRTSGQQGMRGSERTRLGRRQQRERVPPFLVRRRDDDQREVLIGPPRRPDPGGQDNCHGAAPERDGAGVADGGPQSGQDALQARREGTVTPPRGPGNATNAFQAATVSRTGNGIPWARRWQGETGMRRPSPNASARGRARSWAVVTSRPRAARPRCAPVRRTSSSGRGGRGPGAGSPRSKRGAGGAGR
jgi:hypothetical protein